MVKLFGGADGRKYLLVVEDGKRVWKVYQDFGWRTVTGEPTVRLQLIE